MWSGDVLYVVGDFSTLNVYDWFYCVGTSMNYYGKSFQLCVAEFFFVFFLLFCFRDFSDQKQWISTFIFNKNNDKN